MSSDSGTSEDERAYQVYQPPAQPQLDVDLFKMQLEFTVAKKP